MVVFIFAQLGAFVQPGKRFNESSTSILNYLSIHDDGTGEAFIIGFQMM